MPEPVNASKSYRKALRPLKRALGLVWLADSKSTLAMAGLTFMSGLLPVAQAWVAKLIIDSVITSLSEHQDPKTGLLQLLPYLYLEFGFLLTGSIIAQFRRLLNEILDHKIGFLINSKIIRKALGLELHYFENAEFYDKMQNARKQSEYRAMAIVNAIFQLTESAITLSSFLALLLAFSPWVAVLLFGAALPSFVAQNKYSVLNFRLQSWKAPESRRMVYYEHLLTVDSSAKEIQTFGLGEPLLGRYADLFWKVFREDSKLAWKRSWASLGWGLLSTSSYYACYAWVIFRTLAGVIGIGSMTLYLVIFRQSQGTFNGIFDGLSKLYENGIFMETLFEFLDLPEREVAAADSPQLFTADPTRGIEFENVSFRYPEQKNWAIQNLSLIIRPGEKIALVGENGSGKTTLIKLLTRLYDPTEGKVLYQGIDLKDWPLVELRKRMGVIFQDFVRYQLTLRENVGFGSIEDMDNQDRLERAADQGGMLEMLPGFNEGWETTLGGWFQKGRELSGGQWQKIALSRAFMREGEVIVLDEPTSALDAEKEYEIFQRFQELTAGKIAFLISHRFSTVRMADQIVVLKEGKIVESGSHRELIAKNGTYANLFEMQAEGYR
ncbi:MAG: ABC transporter ATP-binding protein [Bdellovibrionales bacterium]|nr:ABC transporter ATP-binding protein [Oligoflexia bacterium]